MPERWADGAPTETGTEVDPAYFDDDARRKALEDDDGTEVGYTDAGEIPDAFTDADETPSESPPSVPDPAIDDRSDAAATDEATEQKEEDANVIESAWAARGEQRTTFYADDAEADDGVFGGSDFDRLWAINTGTFTSDRSRIGRVDFEAAETREMTEAVASALDLTDRQKERACQISLEMDGRRFNWCGGRPAMALSACARAVADGPDEAQSHPAIASDTFEALTDRVTTVDVSRLIEFAFEN